MLKDAERAPEVEDSLEEGVERQYLVEAGRTSYIHTQEFSLERAYAFGSDLLDRSRHENWLASAKSAEARGDNMSAMCFRALENRRLRWKYIMDEKLVPLDFDGNLNYLDEALLLLKYSLIKL